jgi:hypothetical protein
VKVYSLTFHYQQNGSRTDFQEYILPATEMKQAFVKVHFKDCRRGRGKGNKLGSVCIA